MSMYRQLWLAIIISMLLALGGSLLASILSAHSYLESQLSIKNTDSASLLALSLGQGDPDAVSVELAVSALFDGGHYELIHVVDPNGKTIVERRAAPGRLNAPDWFVSRLPIQATPGQAQISNGWRQFGTVTVISHSRFAYGALWHSVLQTMGALALAGLVGGYLGSLTLRRLTAPLRAVIDQATAITERRFVTIDEPRVPELKQLAVAMNATVGRLKSMFEEEAARLETVRQEANFDPLTGLLNRSHFMARLRQSLDAEDGVGGALLLIRLADLAGINRRHGRAATDDFLKRTGETIAQCAGVAARLNGADFAVMLSGEVNGRVSAEALLKALVETATPFIESETAAWIGVGTYAHGMDIGTVLARIDSALAGAEAEGKNAVHEADAGVENQPRTAEQWSTMIQRALDHQWVRLISFPVIELSGKLSHRECPLRLMFDEQGEWLLAGQFLPIAERLRLTPALDLVAVTLGLHELQSQPDLPGLAINLSASSVSDGAFRKKLLALLAAHRTHAARLWLEVPENGALKHLPVFRELCHALKAVGCRVGLEHFGHQFSQIGLLHEIGLDYLKVDSSFIHGLDSNPGNATFLKGLSGIAHSIGLQVLAEGVATLEELQALHSVGFDGATGPAIRAVE
ncbi:EAL domain-containing protein [Propionivibrio sp.]|uniref:bifunctional diguanylate cyclase/phosphodiesterase n=1 Tax=Propionivibrio sp. TaxID=2212460 RepID=UPI00260CB3AF|nr:EAL domain-containing protein [Propionivibrio sp.]